MGRHMEDRLREIDARRAAGEVVAVDPDEADEMGLCEETALSLEDALAARFDGGGVPGSAGVEIPAARAGEAPDSAPADGSGGESGGAAEDADDGGYELDGDD